jgi:hypothetical protein
MNRILTLQNEEAQIKLLRARTHIYGRATLLMTFQVLLTVIAPVAGAALSVFWPASRAYVAAISLAAVIIDSLVLDRQYKLLMKRAAKIAEQFDCTVLEIGWDQFTVGDRVDAEDIHSDARSYSARHDDAKLRGWYPESVGSAPLHLARIICQRTNLRYDRQLRRSYGIIIQVVTIAIVGGLFISCLVQNLPMADWVLTMAPAAPVLGWAAREYYRQRDTADFLEDLMKEAKRVWGQAISGECGAVDCGHRSREFQNAIYSRRANSPLVMPFLYRIKRLQLEDEMNAGADDFLRDLANLSKR